MSERLSQAVQVLQLLARPTADPLVPEQSDPLKIRLDQLLKAVWPEGDGPNEIEFQRSPLFRPVKKPWVELSEENGTPVYPPTRQSFRAAIRVLRLQYGDYPRDPFDHAESRKALRDIRTVAWGLRAISLQHEWPEESLAVVLNDIGSAVSVVDGAAPAIPWVEAALNEWERAGSPAERRAFAFHNLADLHRRLGNHETALRGFQRALGCWLLPLTTAMSRGDDALKIMQGQNAYDEHPRLVTVTSAMMSIGNVLGRLGRLTEAQLLLNAVTELREALLLGAEPGVLLAPTPSAQARRANQLVSTARNNAGVLLLKRAEGEVDPKYRKELLERAVVHFEKASTLRMGQDPLQKLLADHNYWTARGRLATGQELREVIAKLERVLKNRRYEESDDASLGRSCRSLGEMTLKAGDVKGAIAHYAGALSYLRRALGEDHFESRDVGDRLNEARRALEEAGPFECRVPDPSVLDRRSSTFVLAIVEPGAPMEGCRYLRLKPSYGQFGALLALHGGRLPRNQRLQGEPLRLAVAAWAPLTALGGIGPLLLHAHAVDTLGQEATPDRISDEVGRVVEESQLWRSMTDGSLFTGGTAKRPLSPSRIRNWTTLLRDARLRRSPRLTRLCSPRLTPLIIRMSMHETACA